MVSMKDLNDRDELTDDELDAELAEAGEVAEQELADKHQDTGFKRGFDLGVKTMMRATGTQTAYADYYKRVRKWRFEERWTGIGSTSTPPMPWHEGEVEGEMK